MAAEEDEGVMGFIAGFICGAVGVPLMLWLAGVLDIKVER